MSQSKKNDKKNNIMIDSLENQTAINNKILYAQKIIQNTIVSIQYYKLLDIFSNNDINICITTLTELFLKFSELIQENKNKTNPHEKIVSNYETLMEKLEIIIKSFGTKNIQDILYISFGETHASEAERGDVEKGESPTLNRTKDQNSKVNDAILESKYSLILNNLQPIGYKIIHYKKLKDFKNDEAIQTFYCENKIVDNIGSTYSHNYECYEADFNKSFYLKTNGIQTIIKNKKLKKILIINCIVQDIPLELFTISYIDFRKKSIIDNIPNNSYDLEIINRMCDSLTIKDILIYGNEDIYKKYCCLLIEINSIKSNKIDITIKNFLSQDLYSQRNTLINLLIYYNDYEIQYITYLLYDLLSIYTADNTHSQEQKQLFDSFSFKLKSYFKDVMSLTIKNTQEMISKNEINKISLEQQIYLMKAPEIVKDKALVKLKEIKNKSDDSNIKAKQYLEGLLKIPFGIYKNEPILKRFKEINQIFNSMILKNKNILSTVPIEKKEFYTRSEMNQYIKKMESFIISFFFKDIKNKIASFNNKMILAIIHFLQNMRKNIIFPLQSVIPSSSIQNDIVERNNIDQSFSKSLEEFNRIFDELLKTSIKQKRIQLLNSLLDIVESNIIIHDSGELIIQLFKIYEIIENNIIQQPFTKIPFEIKEINNQLNHIGTNINEIIEILDESIHGHRHAKNQILKIIAQWMTGEQSGYSFGFEGSPGIGKTSLAKNGISKCLKDENGVHRPFAFIALGGSTNGSTLEGHNYTYVNSSWGKIVDILMETKCMNPIIYIDELDKVSNTEQGREIISILTHMIDSTQNELFQDKYFSGISIDLSKTLFIFSYNDPDKIDKVLLDRIHRIKFDNLTIKDKLTIVDNFITPSINKKMGFSNIIHLSKDTIEYIIEHYTMEPGVRKLKEILFDLYGEINIQILRENLNIDFPMEVSIADLENKYLVQYTKIEDKKINDNGKIGIINGLWANLHGKGGILPIEVVFFPSSSLLDLRLTGLQGDVMKESMNVAKSIAWKLTSENNKKSLLKIFDTTKCQGLHIHCTDGAVSKDGPSAGAAITTAIYSLLNGKIIRPDVAMTGEINLQGDITAIGGLEAKILGALRSGIKRIMYPISNSNDFIEMMKKYDEINILFKDVEFIQVSNINEVLEKVFII